MLMLHLIFYIESLCPHVSFLFLWKLQRNTCIETIFSNNENSNFASYRIIPTNLPKLLFLNNNPKSRHFKDSSNDAKV